MDAEKNRKKIAGIIFATIKKIKHVSAKYTDNLVKDLNFDSFDMVNFEHEVSTTIDIEEIDTEGFLKAKTVKDYVEFYSTYLE
jgi:acyl carrier protein